MWSVSSCRLFLVVFRRVFRLGTHFDKTRVELDPVVHAHTSSFFHSSAPVCTPPFLTNRQTSPFSPLPFTQIYRKYKPNYPRQDPYERSIALLSTLSSTLAQKQNKTTTSFPLKENREKKEGSRKLLNKSSSVFSYSLHTLELLASIFMCLSPLRLPGPL